MRAEAGVEYVEMTVPKWQRLKMVLSQEQELGRALRLRWQSQTKGVRRIIIF